MPMPTERPANYRPRRRRSGTPPPFQITPRDLDILRAVARYRFLNSRHITMLVSGSAKNIRNRLKGLFEHGLLDRPECQYDFYRPGGGSSLAVYALADKGALLLDRASGASHNRRLAWSQKNRAAGRPFLEHALAVADFAVDLHAAIAGRPDIELVDRECLVGRFPAATQDLPKPLRLTAPVIFNGTRHVIGTEPDYAFSLGFPQLGRRANFLVEIDRGTMPVERLDLKASSILRKVLAYQAIWNSRLHTTKLGWQNFRVLMLTTSPERAEGMRDCVARHAGRRNSPLFWFSDRGTLARTGDLTRGWTDGDGAAKSIAVAVE